MGLPWNYSYDTVENIEKQDIRFRNEEIKWNTEQGKLLEESLILSEDEQIFGIFKSILQLQTHRVLLNSIYPSATFIFVYGVGNVINQRLNLYARPLSVNYFYWIWKEANDNAISFLFQLRLVLYSILSIFGLGIWSFAKDFTQVQYDTHIGKSLCELGPGNLTVYIMWTTKVRALPIL